MSAGFTESVVEEAALAWLESICWYVAHGPDIATDTCGAPRAEPMPRTAACSSRNLVRPPRGSEAIPGGGSSLER
jgi:hypothetical protein